MTRKVLLGVLALTVSLAPSCGARATPTNEPGRTDVRLERIVSGLDHPVHLTAPAGDPRLFIVEQKGRIRIVSKGRLLGRPFLDIAHKVRSGGERGILSVAFHPQYARNGFFFVNYTDRNGDTRVERYGASNDPNLANPATATLVITIAQPYSNHNGGHVLFGPDGMLYIGMGDGGSGGDPHGNGQNLGALLGKLLRIDVNHGMPYRVPRDNPFVNRTGVRPEIWAYGLRNPWRICFDVAESLLVIADVGQNQWEEIDVVPLARGGLNYGWNRMEGSHCYGSPDCDRTGLVLPLAEYGHYDGCSITGGVIYRGRKIPSLRGHYVYADYCDGWIESFKPARGKMTERSRWSLREQLPVSSFGVDGAGELYVVSHDGRVFAVVPNLVRSP